MYYARPLLSAQARQYMYTRCGVLRNGFFKPSFSCTLSASSRPALPAAAPASRYAVHCGCSSSVVESVRGDNDLCDKAALNSYSELGHPVGLFSHDSD